MWCLSRWLFLNNAPKLGQYLLLISAVTVGRVIFSEVDYHILATKLGNLLTWDTGSILHAVSIVLALSKLDLARIGLAALVLTVELMQALLGNPNKRYKTLRSPIFSTLMLLMVVLFSGGDLTNAVYGAR